ncbi:ABC transporter permease [Cohnella phaseoli]|uniref:Putative aldouronate transport system permease protein n=1 Tax=Cohnella phaseoli TaxID=456490 RepID=A0A3D9HZR8_9BACL|nr:ABC transporter permease subunit [Cohnella phaseoli]RED54994.1 putative aldouronate transport system permease protein [Cohnella phaseoli]
MTEASSTSIRRKRHIREGPLHLMMLPAVVLLILFSYLPMVGIVLAFERFNPSKGFFGSPFVGWDNFKYVMNMPGIGQVMWNTVYISLMKIVAGLIAPIAFALLLNEIVGNKIKRTIQTLIYLPHFLSWVILGGIMIDILSPSGGLLNSLLGTFGIEPIFFLGNERMFPYVLVLSDVWKEFGFGTIIYLAAITSINPSLYEAALCDGASRFKQTLHITLPGMAPIIVLMMTLSLGNVLNAGFDQVFNLYSPVVYRTGDILDTLVYRLGLLDAQYGVATAVGLFKSVVSTCFIVVSYLCAYRFANYRIF